MLQHPPWQEVRDDVWKNWWKATPKDEFVGEIFAPQAGEKISDAAAVMIAMAAALRGVGHVSPNPLVGCTVVSESGRFLSAGAHLKFGSHHAEVNAFAGLPADEIRGAKAFVTLEPCAHFGKTPPCADFLARMPLGSVNYVIADPDSRVNGAGAARISGSGIPVHRLDLWKEQGEELAEIFLWNQRQKRIFVGLKVASTLSGIYALPGSSRYWITGERAREYGHYLRMVYDGILVGANTVALDNPSLDVRHAKLQGRMPMRFVLDPQGTILSNDTDRKLWKNLEDKDKPFWLVGPAVKSSLPVNLVTLPINSFGEFAWADILKVLWDLGCRSLLIEGGANVWQSAFKNSIVDKLHWFAAPDRPELKNGLKWDVAAVFEQGLESNFLLGQDQYFERGNIK